MLVAAVAAHFAMVLWVCSTEVFALFAGGQTVLPESLGTWSRAVRTYVSSPPGAHQPLKSVRHLAKTYLNLAGIDAGYGLFAPNVPNGYRLTFALRDREGVIQIEALSPQHGETGLRVASFLDTLGREQAGEIRDVMLEYIAKSALHAHPEGWTVHLAVETIKIPTLTDYEAGKERSYDLVYAYDFVRVEAGVEPIP